MDSNPGQYLVPVPVLYQGTGTVQLCWAVFRIRLDFIRIRIQLFKWMRIRIQVWKWMWIHAVPLHKKTMYIKSNFCIFMPTNLLFSLVCLIICLFLRFFLAFSIFFIPPESWSAFGMWIPDPGVHQIQIQCGSGSWSETLVLQLVISYLLCLQPLAEQVFPREELPREPAVAGQVQRQPEPLEQGTELSHASLRQLRENLRNGCLVTYALTA
jgi:hypothetical protein